MSRHFLSKTVLHTPICRLWYIYVLPLACLLWISCVSLHRPPYIHPTSATITAVPVPVAAATSNSSTVTGDFPGAHDDNVVTAAPAAAGGNTVTPVVNRDGRRADGITDTAVENSRRRPRASRPPSDLCAGRYVYVHDLPRRFNADMLRDCGTLSRWTNMCRSTSNAGLGPPLRRSGGVLLSSGWYATDQFALDVIFYNRMKRYPCLTKDSTLASAVYVPFFAGLDVARYLWGYNATIRDAAALDLMRWLRSRREWRAMGGKDHFLTAGRIAWDFRRSGDDSNPDWGNNLLLLPEARNMSVLVLESGPPPGNDFSVPYPAYFHPSRQAQVGAWQRRMRGAKRPWLFSFAGAPRPDQAGSIRGLIIEQCRASRRCRHLDCGASGGRARGCYSPGSVMREFESSNFCLQPPGDSYTRRSAFDAMVAACVPVFFHPASAYVQYRWHLPRNHSSYSVFIPEAAVREGGASIEQRLAAISAGEVRAMREEVIGMLPRLVYADPRPSRVAVKDAFDFAVEGVLRRVRRLREEMGRDAAGTPPTAESGELDQI